MTTSAVTSRKKPDFAAFRMPPVEHVHYAVTSGKLGRLVVTAHRGSSDKGAVLGRFVAKHDTGERWHADLTVESMYRSQGIGRALLRMGADMIFAIGGCIASTASPEAKAFWALLSDVIEIVKDGADRMIVRRKGVGAELEAAAKAAAEAEKAEKAAARAARKAAKAAEEAAAAEAARLAALLSGAEAAEAAEVPPPALVEAAPVETPPLDEAALAALLAEGGSGQ